MKGQMFKPGTVALVIFIAIVGYMSYTLVSGNVNEIGETASDERKAAMDCSELDVNFVEVDEKDRNVTVFFRSSDDLSGISIGFEGLNTTRTMTDIQANTIHNATVNVSDFDNIYIETARCPDAYRWR